MSVTIGTVLTKVGISSGTKVVKKVVTEPESAAKWVIIFLLAIFAPLILIVALMFGMVSGVQGYATSDMDDLLQSDLYKKIENIDSRYEVKREVELYAIAMIENDISIFVPSEEDDLEDEEASETEKIKVDEENIETNTEELAEREEDKLIEIEAVDAVEMLTDEEMKAVLTSHNISFEIEAPNLAYTLSYITHCDSARSKWGNVFVLDEESEETVSIQNSQIRNFYDSITSVETRTEVDSDGKTHIIYYLAVLSPEEVAAIYWSDDVQTEQMYIDSYNIFCEIYDFSEKIDYEIVDSNFSVPLYFQTDYKHVEYGRGTVATSGCAPTAIAMCVSYWTGQAITPDVVVAWTGDRYYNYGPGGGSYWSIFPACASHWGCTSTQVNSSDIATVKDALSNGYPVIASMGTGHFTSGGHFIVLCGMTDDGKLIVNDPSRSNYTKHGAEVPAEWVFSESKGYFIIRGGQ